MESYAYLYIDLDNARDENRDNKTKIPQIRVVFIALRIVWESQEMPSCNILGISVLVSWGNGVFRHG